MDLDLLEEAVEPVLFEDKPTGQFTINMEKLVDMDKAKRDAQKLFEATEDQFGTDEEEMVRIFALPEVYQSRATYDEYVKVKCLHHLINQRCQFYNYNEDQYTVHGLSALTQALKTIKVFKFMYVYSVNIHIHW